MTPDSCLHCGGSDWLRSPYREPVRVWIAAQIGGTLRADRGPYHPDCATAVEDAEAKVKARQTMSGKALTSKPHRNNRKR